MAGQTNRTATVRFLQQGAIGDLFAVAFLVDGREVAHWPIHGGLPLAALIENWVLRGDRPDAIKATIVTVKRGRTI